ncbi:ATP-binding cassette domain-containing protein [Halomonas sp. MA07-2]|uniref:ATP-binding cassette domain-containing protein n=1 Tax=Halomonas sp. MA07-2 TaxID=3440841 RepID=UPI003EEB1910
MTRAARSHCHSGGQRQRVAMARGLVREPAVFLFDEPLSNLDAKLRVQMRVEIKKLQRRLKTTSLYVTHDQLEAMTLGDRLVVLNDGRIEQVGSPMEIYARPASLFVTTFIGSPAVNLIPLDYLHTNGGGDTAKALLHDLPKGTDIVGIRPDDQPTVIRIAGQPPVAEGETLRFHVTREALHPFNRGSGKRTGDHG